MVQRLVLLAPIRLRAHVVGVLETTGADPSGPLLKHRLGSMQVLTGFSCAVLAPLQVLCMLGVSREIVSAGVWGGSSSSGSNTMPTLSEHGTDFTEQAREVGGTRMQGGRGLNARWVDARARSHATSCLCFLSVPEARLVCLGRLGPCAHQPDCSRSTHSETVQQFFALYCKRNTNLSLPPWPHALPRVGVSSGASCPTCPKTRGSCCRMRASPRRWPSTSWTSWASREWNTLRCDYRGW